MISIAFTIFVIGSLVYMVVKDLRKKDCKVCNVGKLGKPEYITKYYGPRNEPIQRKAQVCEYCKVIHYVK